VKTTLYTFPAGSGYNREIDLGNEFMTTQVAAAKKVLSRRSSLKLAVSVGVMGAARPALAQPAIGKGTTLTVSTWGGVTSDGIRDYVGPEFEKQTGAKLAFDIGGQGARYNKLLAQKGNQSSDVFFGTDEAVVGGLKAGVLQTASVKAVPNYTELYDWSKTVKTADPENEVAGVPYTLISYVLAYNPETVKTKPTSWGDMWRPEFSGKLALAAPAHSQMPALVIIAAELAGGSATNVNPGFAKLAQLRPDKLTFFWTDWAPMLKTGDTNSATEFDYYLESMKAQGYPIDYVFPAEGAIGAAECAALVAGTKNREVGQAFLNLMIDAKIQETFATKTFQGPTNKNVRLTGSVAAKMSYGEDKLEHIRFFDPVAWYEVRPAWTERLNTEVVPEWGVR
jgi:putative spermidine/putrescine transport system substrate-binding protein